MRWLMNMNGHRIAAILIYCYGSAKHSFSREGDLNALLPATAKDDYGYQQFNITNDLQMIN